MELGAWGDAVASFALALDDGLDQGFPPEERVDLFAKAARAGAADHDLQSCERYGLAAVALATELGDLEAWCDAVSELGHARVRVAQGGAPEPVAELEQFIAAAGERVPKLRARVLGLMAEVCFAAFDFDKGLAYTRRARQLAEAEGDDDVIAFVLFAQGLQHQGRLELDESDQCFAESVAHGDAIDSFVSGWARARLPSAHWLRGELHEAETAASEAEKHAAARMDWAELSLISAWRANAAGAAGRFGEAEMLAERALALQRRSDYAFTQIVANPPLAIARAMRGNVEGAHRGLDEWREQRKTRWIDQLDTLVDALAGNLAAVRSALEKRPWRVLADEAIDLRRASALFAQVEVGVMAGAPELVTPARGSLETLHERGVRFAPGSLSLLSRLCSAAAAMDGDGEAAQSWLETARHDGRGAGATAELARCDLDEAILLMRGDGVDTPTVDRLLTSASATFDRLGMLPFLRRAEQILGTSASAPSARARKVILFTDLVGSTSLNVTAGDDAYVQLLRAHDRVVRDALRRYDGVEFKHTGDGVAAWFTSARQAVACALDLQDTLAGALHAESGVAVRVRCGLAAGDPIESSGDLFGLAVSTASRICELAESGMVLVSEDIPSMAAGGGFRFSDRGAVELRGIPGVSHVLSAQPGHT
jgi:class 3 adenylate cyclase